MYVLDTDICIYLLNGTVPEISERLRIEPADKLAVTTVTAAELRYGALRSQRREQNLQRVEQFVAPLTQLSFSPVAAIHFASIKEKLATAGRLIGPMDMLIAAIVRSIDATLVSNNEREFCRVENLKLENWKRK